MGVYQEEEEIMQASDPFIFSFKDKADDMDIFQRAEIHEDIQCFEQRLLNMTCKHHPHRRAEIVCQHKFVCTECLEDRKVHDVWKISDIALNYSTLVDQIEDNHLCAIAHTESHFLRIKACIEDIKSRVSIFESDMQSLYLSIKRSQDSVRAQSEASVSAQLREIEGQLYQGTLPSNTMKACQDICVKYGLSDSNAWHVVRSISIHDNVGQSAFTFPKVSMGQCGRLHCELEPCPKWNGTAGSDFCFIVRINDGQGRRLSPMHSILTYIKAEFKQGEQSSSLNVSMTENSYALVNVKVAMPTERVVVMVTINNLLTVFTPPMKFSAMPTVCPATSWAKACNLAFPISGHAATSFKSKIYVTGGISEGKSVGSGAVFSVASLDWVETLPMSSVRANHGLVECNGCLWMMGGFLKGQCSKSMEMYNFSKHCWDKAPCMPQHSAEFAAISHNKFIYLIGGSGSAAEAFIFDCHLFSWSKLLSKMK